MLPSRQHLFREHLAYFLPILKTNQTNIRATWLSSKWVWEQNWLVATQTCHPLHIWCMMKYKIQQGMVMQHSGKHAFFPPFFERKEKLFNFSASTFDMFSFVDTYIKYRFKIICEWLYSVYQHPKFFRKFGCTLHSSHCQYEILTIKQHFSLFRYEFLTFPCMLTWLSFYSVFLPTQQICDYKVDKQIQRRNLLTLHSDTQICRGFSKSFDCFLTRQLPFGFGCKAVGIEDCFFSVSSPSI